MAKVYRQGDIVLREVERVPDWYRDNGIKTVSMGGETGKAHTIEGHVFDDRGDTMIVLDATGLLRHEEHGDMEIPPGTYSIGRVREYMGSSSRNAAD